MISYKNAGVDIAAGDSASRSAYAHALCTFAARRGMIGAPVPEDDGYAGLLDMGDYLLVQSTDGTGTKIDLAAAMHRYDTLGYDLLAMVADDAVCTGAEVISVSNCLDVPRIDVRHVDALLRGLADACFAQKIVIPTGEIAEVPGAVTRGVWSATCIGIVAKDRVIDARSAEEGDVIIGLRSAVARSNGFSLIRAILTDAHGERWHEREWRDGTTWGDILLTPSIVYHDAILSVIGRHGEDRAVAVKGIAHITGGGIPSKLRRVLKRSGLGAKLTDLWKPHEAIVDLIALGDVAIEETYSTWNMGTGMLLIVSPADVDRAIDLLAAQAMEARTVGVMTSDCTIAITAYDGSHLVFQ